MARKKSTYPANANPDRPLSGKNSRKRLVDLHCLVIAIIRNPQFKSVDDYIANSSAATPPTLQGLFDTGLVRPDVVKAIAEELGVANYCSLLVNDRGTTECYQSELFRQICLHAIYSLGPDVYTQEEDGTYCKRNMWDEVSHLVDPRLDSLNLSDSQKIAVFEKLRRDGWLSYVADKHYCRKHNSVGQLVWLRIAFINATKGIIDIAFERICQGDVQKSYLIESLGDALEKAKKHRREGLNFLASRRQFYESFGLELGSISQSLGIKVGAIDQAFLQYRYLLKIKYGGVNEAYREQIGLQSAPYLLIMQKILKAVKAKRPNIKTIIHCVREDADRVDHSLQLRDDLLQELKEKGTLTDGKIFDI